MSTSPRLFVRRCSQLMSMAAAVCLPIAAKADVMDETHTLLRTNLTKVQGIFFLIAIFASFMVAHAWWFSDADSRHAKKKSTNWGIGCLFFYGGIGMIQVFKRSFASQAF